MSGDPARIRNFHDLHFQKTLFIAGKSPRTSPDRGTGKAFSHSPIFTLTFSHILPFSKPLTRLYQSLTGESRPKQLQLGNDLIEKLSKKSCARDADHVFGNAFELETRSE
jgi:hypothetical protein